MIHSTVIVLGLGAMGSATVRALAARGVDVVGIDRHHPPHPLGSTHGDSRVTRLACLEGPQYTPLVRRSHELWRELEARTDERLLHQVGTLTLSRTGSPTLEAVHAAAARHSITGETLDADALRVRYPMFAVGEDATGFLDVDGGWLAPEAIVAAGLRCAAQDGARLLVGATVEAWSAGHEGVSVTLAGGETVAGEQLVLCAGPWLPGLLGPDSALAGRFTVRRQLLHWFAIRHGYDQLAAGPAWVWDVSPGGPGEPVDVAHARGFYGLPAIDGPTGGLKLATEQSEHAHAPDDRQHPATPTQVGELWRTLVRDRLPWLRERALRSVSCLYTCTADGHFVIDRHPAHPAVQIVSPCSGHGFKHSAAIGEAVAQRVIGEPTTVDLAPFGLRAVDPGAGRT